MKNIVLAIAIFSAGIVAAYDAPEQHTDGILTAEQRAEVISRMVSE